MKSVRWTKLLLGLAALKLLGGVVGFALGYGSGTPGDETALSPSLRCLLLLAFALTGLFLLISERDDTRAVSLGSFFVILATAFSNRPLSDLLQLRAGDWAWPILIVYVLPADAFLPYFAWSFSQEFPNSISTFKVQRFLTWGRRVSLGAGIAGFVWQVARLIVEWQAKGALTPSRLAPIKPSFEFYAPLLVLVTLALITLLWRTWGAAGEEGRRARLFVIGLVAGLAPLFLEIILEQAFAPYESFISVPGRQAALGLFVVFPFLVAALATTAYSVLVANVLNVRLIARKALQYALARYSAIALAVVPLGALVAYIVDHRSETIAEIFSGGSHLLLLGSSAAVGFGALRYRRTLLDSIDRRFFREQYDARQTLTLLVERIRATHGVADLANLLCREADLALHPESVSLMAVEPRSAVLTDPKLRSRRLDASSSLAALIASASDPLQIDLEDARSPLAKLPEKERYWLVDSSFRIIVPILARDGVLLGLIGLGEKKSGLPFFKEDRQLLRAIASSAAWVLEVELSRSLGSSHRSRPEPEEGDVAVTPPDPAAVAAELAKECPSCGRLYPSYTVFCATCSRRLEPSHVPYMLPNKFRFERRIGTGGMGVVYRATDLSLGRAVAVKTLRRVSPEDAMRLRREARTAAAVSHPHLAPIYGLETWQGTPMLVMELLEGGTLAQRIEKGRLPPRETVELGIAMAAALELLHASDILHRDIKPSNIGYSRDNARDNARDAARDHVRDNTAKLMDFGIARVMFDLRRDLEVTAPAGLEEESVQLPPTSVWNRTAATSLTASKQLVGTLAYLSPEALSGQSADTSFDLWGLAIVLYECLLGRKIFSGGDMHQLMNRIRNGRVPEFAQICPEHDELLGDFFRSALHKTISRRPASARDFRERLAALLPRLAG